MQEGNLHVLGSASRVEGEVLGEPFCTQKWTDSLRSPPRDTAQPGVCPPMRPHGVTSLFNLGGQAEATGVSLFQCIIRHLQMSHHGV